MPYNKLLRGRYAATNHSYVVTFCTAERRQLFLDYASAQAVVTAMNDSADRGYCDQLAYVVMPDHVHWLVSLTGKCSLAALLSATKGAATRSLQRDLGIKIPVWQKGYYEHQVRADDDLLQQARYLVANPLRAGLIKRLVDYPFWFAAWASPPHGPASMAASGEQLLDP